MRRSSRGSAWAAPPHLRRSVSRAPTRWRITARQNGIKWIDGHIEYRELHTVINEAVAGFAHLYTYGVSKCTFLAGLMGRPIHNEEDVNCPSPDSFNHDLLCILSCHKFPKFACANKTAHSLYNWLMYYLQKKDFVQCPPNMTRHTAEIVAAL